MAYCAHGKALDHTAEGEPVTGPYQKATHKVCWHCGVHLPDTWGCSDCEFVEIPFFGEPRGLRFVKGQPCYRHTPWRPEPTRA